MIPCLGPLGAALGEPTRRMLFSRGDVLSRRYLSRSSLAFARGFAPLVVARAARSFELFPVFPEEVPFTPEAAWLLEWPERDARLNQYIKHNEKWVGVLFVPLNFFLHTISPRWSLRCTFFENGLALNRSHCLFFSFPPFYETFHHQKQNKFSISFLTVHNLRVTLILMVTKRN